MQHTDGRTAYAHARYANRIDRQLGRTNRLWLTPTDPVRESVTTADVSLIAGDGYRLSPIHGRRWSAGWPAAARWGQFSRKCGWIHGTLHPA
ncbi:MAG: hypothetical protein R3C44_22500 [Chloroflexota bacterium]